MLVSGSNVYVYESDVEGGPGQDAFYLNPIVDLDSAPGAAGIDLQSGTLVAIGCAIHGGEGGDGLLTGTTCKPSSDGGTGLVAGGSVRRLDCVITGGAAG